MDVVEVEGAAGYFINRQGEVFSAAGKRISVYVDSNGYQYFRKVVKIHRAVACAFHPVRDKDHIVRHLDGNKSNNSAENLKWGTHKENYADSVAHGTRKSRKGIRSSQSKLTEKDVLTIRERAVRETLIEIAKDYPVHKSTIGKIVRREDWSHI